MNILLTAIANYSSLIGEAGRGLLYINWNPSLTFGPFRWYSLCWIMGLACAYFIVRHLFYEQGIAERTVKKNGKKEDYFLSSGKHFIEMLIPIHFMDDGSWKFTGYEGLASHGGTLGLIIALILYVRWSKLNVWTVLDNIAIATGTTACFIRLGNLMNSEIIGKPTDVPWAFIFERVDMVPHHPGQLYEAIAYAILFFIMWYLYKKSRKGMPQNLKPGQTWTPQSRIPQVGTGFYFGLCLTYIFTFRFFIEYTKDIQEDFEADMLFNMGQLLSVPFVIIGVCCMMKAFRKSEK